MRRDEVEERKKRVRNEKDVSVSFPYSSDESNKSDYGTDGAILEQRFSQMEFYDRLPSEINEQEKTTKYEKPEVDERDDPYLPGGPREGLLGITDGFTWVRLNPRMRYETRKVVRAHERLRHFVYGNQEGRIRAMDEGATY